MEAAPRPVILVVDDTPDTLGFLTDALESEGYTALVATGGPQALALVERITPDLILLDAMMPVLDGFETCRRLKAGPIAHVPVIFMTALSDTEHIVRGLGAGGVDYVTKPIILGELFARLRVHLATAQATRSAQVALDTTGSFLIALTRAGTVVWATPQALQLLGAARLQDGAATPLHSAIPSLAEAAARGASNPVVVHGGADAPAVEFSFVGSAGAGEYLFRVRQHDPRRADEILAQRFALTAREAEVLLWIARGKANRDIGEILSLSPRTVNKHLETIFAKLGVENRASAAVLATRALDER
ncbi:response regulator [Lichenifustis flavocetrariae]|uniref:response regulator n=1 Tax=Lichenifustis flavocetrariae TaxID=2949735 RepID=UPI003D0F325B